VLQENCSDPFSYSSFEIAHTISDSATVLASGM